MLTGRTSPDAKKRRKSKKGTPVGSSSHEERKRVRNQSGERPVLKIGGTGFWGGEKEYLISKKNGAVSVAEKNSGKKNMAIHGGRGNCCLAPSSSYRRHHAWARRAEQGKVSHRMFLGKTIRWDHGRKKKKTGHSTTLYQAGVFQQSHRGERGGRYSKLARFRLRS